MTIFELVVAWLIGKALDRAAVKFGPSTPPGQPPRRPPPPKVPDRSRRPTAATVPASTSTPAWPQVVPTGLPPFPGAGWVPDNPPPPAVVSRANALLRPLWASGEGTFKVEKTAGRWIVYRASPTSGGGKGVVAFRESAHSAFLTPPENGRPEIEIGPAIVEPNVPVVLARAPSSSAPRATVPASSSASTSLPTLRRGARGPDVAIAQRALGIAADGIFGPGTEGSVRQHQSARGLTPDGVIGPQTWASLLAGKAA